MGNPWSSKSTLSKRDSDSRSPFTRTSFFLRSPLERDTLTGLITRRCFMEFLDEAVQESLTTGRGFGLLLLTLEGLQQMGNEETSDVRDLLRAVGGRLQQILRGSDVVARIGFEEFGALIRDTDLADARAVADRLLTALTLLLPQGTSLRWCGGLAHFDPEAPLSAIRLLSAADLALQRARKGSGSQAEVFIQGHHRKMPVEDLLQQERRIRTALKEGGLVVYFQPILDLRTGRIMANEVLARVQEADAVVAAAHFVEAAERSGLVRQMDRVIVQKALEEKARRIPSPTKLFINLSGKQFQDLRFIQEVEEWIETLSLNPRDLVFEITETEAITRVENAAEFVQALRERGIQFALDDFGSGFSSFYYLKYLEVDYVKIDGEFVRDLKANDRDARFVRALNTIAHEFGMITVAECVEDAKTLEVLVQIGVDAAQGYFIGRPSPQPVLELPRESEALVREMLPEASGSPSIPPS